eukprot:UN01012
MQNGHDKSVKDSVRFVKQALGCDRKVRPFLLLLKEWAKRTYICDAFNGFCNSYCWVNIGIWFLRNKFQKNIRIDKELDVGDLFILFFHTINRVELSKLSLSSKRRTNHS